MRPSLLLLPLIVGTADGFTVPGGLRQLRISSHRLTGVGVSGTALSAQVSWTGHSYAVMVIASSCLTSC
jgi:hypothetical protein